ncbi:MAG TPA: Crp/Fnr family transcriptional regulator [Anaerolineales bacterium]
MKGRGETSSEILEFLHSVPIFSCLNESSVRHLAGASRFQRINKGEILFFLSDPGESAYVVRSGAVSIVLNSPDGREMVINEMHPGEMFGELELLTRKGRSASAVARTNGELLVIPAEAFLRAMDEEPRLVRFILELTAYRLQKSTTRLMALAFMDAQARLARSLLMLGEEERNTGYVTVSQEELASGSGLIRQTVAKALGEWRRNGWVLTGRGRIVVLNRKALEKLERGQLD